MKQLIMSLVLLCGFITSTKAYDYQTVYSNRIAFFEEDNVIYPMRIDSAIFNNDSIFYPFKNIQHKYTQYSYDPNGLEICHTPYGASWMGNKIIVTPEWNYFFNDENDTIKIKTSAKLYEQWTFFENENAIITATVTQIDTMSFLGVNDSVKTITLQVHWYDTTMSPLPHALEGETIIISKQYGFVYTHNFIYLPIYFVGYLYNLNVNLSGLTNPNLGTQNLTWFDVHDFQIGDELHIKYCETIMDLEAITRFTILKYLNRTNYSDSIVYEIEREIKQGEEYTHDTIFSTINPDTLFDKLSIEPITIDNENLATYNKQFSGTFIRKSGIYPYEQIAKSSDSCWTYILVDGCFSVNEYYKGLGGPYYNTCSLGWGLDEISNQLVYYKKGETTWGTPLVINGIMEQQVRPTIKLYPNPTNDKVFFEIENMVGNIQTEIINLQGKILLSNTINSFNDNISLQNLQAGLYIYRLISENGELIQTGKLSKE